MDIPGLSMAMSQMNIMQQVGISMLSNQFDTAEMTGNAISQMIDSAGMELSVNPSVGSNFDMYVQPPYKKLPRL